jgi:3-phenylpropionate/trans-cinnamate dioxygenase ferredoxin reductase component
MDEVVVVGGSLAGFRAAEALRAEGYDRRIVIVGKEPHRPYDRPPLSKQLLTGDSELPDRLYLETDDELGIEWELGVGAGALDLGSRAVELTDGRRIGFDGLVLACGTHARRPPFVLDLDGVMTLRTLDDAIALRRRLRQTRRLAVVGAGFIGCEVAAAARALGIEVALIDVAPAPLAAALGNEVGAACAGLHAEHGVVLELGCGVAGLESAAGALSGIRLDDGRLIVADTAVIGVGAAPSTAWLEGSGLQVRDGVECDARLRAVGAGDVVAVGDVARWPNPTFDGRAMRVEHWTHAAESAAAGARALLHGDDAPAFAPAPTFWSDQYDVRIQSIGVPALADECVITERDADGHRLVATYRHTGTLVGAAAFNAPGALARMRGGIGGVAVGGGSSPGR